MLNHEPTLEDKQKEMIGLLWFIYYRVLPENY